MKKGTYSIAGTLHIKASGVVLRGEGDGEKETLLVATGKGQRTLIDVSGPGRLAEVKNSRRAVNAEYVPCCTRAVPCRTFTGGTPVPR